MSRYDIVGTKECECGCGTVIPLRGWHYEKHGIIPRFIVGHNHARYFKKGNKQTWKGGEVWQNGYILVYQPDHPYHNSQGKGYVRRARLVMEKCLGRYLEKSEVIHHINGIRDDDRIENLIILTNSKHLSIHHKGTIQSRNRNGQFVKEVMSNDTSANE